MELKEDDIVMCTVKKIEGATVFVDIEENGEGSIVMSEIAAGRIRNIRDYVILGKKIVCKILKAAKGHIELSLRRVTSKEKEEIKEKYEKERNLLSMLKASVKTPEEIFKKIKLEYDAQKFLEEARTNPSILENFIPKSELSAFSKILAEKKEKEKVIKKNIMIKSFSPEGIKEIKNILQIPKNVEINYLGSSKFSISAKARDFKQANLQVHEAIEQIKNKAKEKKVLFEAEEK
ncbi:MAG TPA: S1 RNA-binding domain-containing protein [Candidatus Nanoarchaeia archaeon]|nr:S1 RNA-binding domain-containing protein [Candidatus Nanoarchaeia archaeon]